MESYRMFVESCHVSPAFAIAIEESLMNNLSGLLEIEADDVRSGYQGFVRSWNGRKPRPYPSFKTYVPEDHFLEDVREVAMTLTLRTPVDIRLKITFMRSPSVCTISLITSNRAMQAAAGTILRSVAKSVKDECSGPRGLVSQLLGALLALLATMCLLSAGAGNYLQATAALLATAVAATGWSFRKTILPPVTFETPKYRRRMKYLKALDTFLFGLFMALLGKFLYDHVTGSKPHWAGRG
jgi:hypothetical protein